MELEHLEEVMGKLWRHSGRKPSNEPVKTEIDLNAFAGYCYVCKENVYRATHCPNKEVKNSEVGGIGRHFNGNCNQCVHQGHKKSECWELPENEDKRPVDYKTKTKYGNTPISGITGIEFLLWALGGEQFGGKEDALECLEKKHEEKEQT